ncbi:MAG TPA: DUF4242 domain-containing protein [Solirubrobacterales bacterium]|nr:DUF4242 domain-containing protein [Solirubrobacterales bacterium]
MRTFVIERTIPGASELSEQQLRGIAEQSNQAMAALGKPYAWLYSYVAGDKFYCVHGAEGPDDVRDHARIGGFPIDSVTEVAATVDGRGRRELPI